MFGHHRPAPFDIDGFEQAGAVGLEGQLELRLLAVAVQHLFQRSEPAERSVQRGRRNAFPRGFGAELRQPTVEIGGSSVAGGTTDGHQHRKHDSDTPHRLPFIRESGRRGQNDLRATLSDDSRPVAPVRCCVMFIEPLRQRFIFRGVSACSMMSAALCRTSVREKKR